MSPSSIAAGKMQRKHQRGRSRRTMIRLVLQDAATVQTKRSMERAKIYQSIKWTSFRTGYAPHLFPLQNQPDVKSSSLLGQITNLQIGPANRRGRRGQAEGGLGGGENCFLSSHWFSTRDVRAMLVLSGLTRVPQTGKAHDMGQGWHG
jgi:hypothetical protein